MKRKSASSASSSNAKKPKKPSPPPMTTSRRQKLEEPVPKAEEEFAEEPEGDIEEDPEDQEEEQGSEAEAAKSEEAKKRKAVAVSKTAKRSSKNNGDVDGECRFDGDAVPMGEAQLRWPHRYSKKNGGKQVSMTKIGEDDGVVLAKCHYLRAKVDGITYYLYDNAYVKAAEGEADYIGRILEFFETHDKQLYFSVQWFFRTEDTVIKDKEAVLHDPRRVFLSDEKDDNLLDCIVSKVNIVRATPNIDLSSKEKTIPFCDLYYDMSFSPAYSTFAKLSPEEDTNGSKTPSSLTEESDPNLPENKSESESEFVLLDLYSGCGGMSTGLCLGARSTGLNLQTRWAVDLNPYACESLKLNHPNTEVRNEKAEDFLSLLHEWDKLCRDSGVFEEKVFLHDVANSNDDDTEDLPLSSDEFEVGKILGIRFEKTDKKESGLQFKVRWKGYGPDEDTWEPVEGLSTCEESIQEFVRHGYRSNILPLPGRVDVICGGPPCQGISGFNRFRNVKEPLADPKNYQLKVFMDIVDFLKPKYVLMENVVDILKFAGGCLGRFALSRLVAMNYQARLGILPAGSFGVPQFRLRAFLWGASPTKSNVIPYKENEGLQLERALVLKDALSDLPAVGNDEARDEMEYGGPPITDFQKFIRLSKKEMMHSSSALGDKQTEEHKLFDHRPLKLKNDDYLRVCQIPKKKGANFRNLRGVKVGTDNIVYWDPDVERVKLPSGKPLVPDYAMKFVKGKSLKPFGRLWWDEIIATVVTRAEPHNQAVIHPIQDRVLTVREDARLQGFPDYYKLCGPIKERYIQVGNAVAVPVARALGYALGVAFQGKGSEEALLELPSNFHKFEAADVVVDS